MSQALPSRVTAQLKKTLSSHTPTMKHVTLHDGQQMPVLVVGQGEPVVLVHGFGMEASAWLPFVLPLAHKYQFYLPYMRAFGKAYDVSFSQPSFIADYVEDLGSMRAQFGLNRIRLGGISMGALTNLALHDAGQFEGVTHLLHIDQSPVMHNKTDWQWGVMGDQQPQFFNQLKTLCQQTHPYMDVSFQALPQAVKHIVINSVATMVSASFHTRGIQPVVKQIAKYPSLAGKLRNTLGWQNQLHIVKAYLAQDYDYRASAEHIDIPVTVVTGAKSALYAPEGQHVFVEKLKNVTHIVLPNSGHATLFDSPMGSYHALKSFLEAA